MVQALPPTYNLNLITFAFLTLIINHRIIFFLYFAVFRIMCSTKTNIAERIVVGIKLLVDNILSVRFLDFCHAELVSASLPYGEGSDLRRNDKICHAEFISASLPFGEGSDLRRNDGFVVETRLIAPLREPLIFNFNRYNYGKN